MRRDNCSIIGFIQFVMFVATKAYSTGAPDDACVRMFPSHGYSKQTIPCPYTITLSSSTYYPGQTITVTIRGSDPLKGVILQARRVGSDRRFRNLNKDPEGRFDQLPETLQYLTCNNLFNSTVTHIDNTEKQQVQVDWVAPPTFIGRIKFYATIVYNISTYWVREKSEVIVEQSGAEDESDDRYVTTESLTTERSLETYTTKEESVVNTTEEISIETSSSKEVSLETTKESLGTSTTKGVSVETSTTAQKSLQTSTPNNINSTNSATPENSPVNNSMETTIMTEIITSLNSTLVSTDIDVPVSTTEIDITRYLSRTNASLVINMDNVTDQTIKVTSSDVTVLQSSTQDYITFKKNTDNAEVTGEDMSTYTTENSDITDDVTLSTPTELPITNVYSTKSPSTLNPTQTQNNNVTSNNSQSFLPISTTTIKTAIESHTGKHIAMVTNLLDTSVIFKMTITSIEFTDSLTDQSSNEFKELADDIRMTMENIYSTWSGFLGCRVIEFSRGSVVSETELIFETPLSDEERSSAIGELYTLVEENGGIGNYTVSDIQTVGNEGVYVSVDPCILLPCPVNLVCYVQDSRCILSCDNNKDFCPNGDCKEDANGTNLICSNGTDVKVAPSSGDSNEIVIAMVLIGASVFIIVLVIILFIFICKSWRKRRRRWRRRRQNQDVQLFGFEDNKHIRLNGGIPVADISGSRGRYLVEAIDEPTDAPFFTSHPTEPNFTGRGSIGSLASQHSVFDRAFSSAAQSDLDEHDYDYDVVNRSRSVSFIETPQILGDDQSAGEFGIENFSFGVPKYVDREDDGGSYRVRWDFKVDDPATTDMDIAL